MRDENLAPDDFKKLFANMQAPNVPAKLEENIMTKIALLNAKQTKAVPNWFSNNLAFFGLSIFILSTLAIIQYLLPFRLTELVHLKKFVQLSMGVFFILWVIEVLDAQWNYKPSKHFLPDTH